jgi:SAM-dependent methyltransferase
MNKTCICCNSSGLIEMDFYSSLPRVSSDSKLHKSGGKIGRCNVCGHVQKIIDTKFIGEISEIYSAYDMYSEDASDQPIFINDQEITRSKILVDDLITKWKLPQKGRLLEIGAGKGAFIYQFCKYFPEWKINSLEYDNKYIKYLDKNENFEKNYIDIDEIEYGGFDLIVSIHTIEHILDPVIYLKKAKKMLKNHGKMFFQVPDVANSPFDIVIADHVSHFSRRSFKEILTKAGLQSRIRIVIPKEITAYCSKDVVDSSIINNDYDVFQNINYLHRIGDLIKNYSSNHKVGIYGTTIAANWLTNWTGEIGFYVDDDVTKVGKKMNEKNIYEINKVPVGSHIFLPFTRSTNNIIIKKLANIIQLKKITLIPLE